jgi:integrase
MMMLQKLELTRMPMPEGVEERWRKVVDGKTYYFRGKYSVALRLWHKKQEELEAAKGEAWRGKFAECLASLNEHWRGKVEAIVQDYPFLGPYVVEIMASSDYKPNSPETLFNHLQSLVVRYEAKEKAKTREQIKGMTLSELIAKFLATKGDVAESTKKGLVSSLSHFLEILGNIPIKEINAEKLQEFTSTLWEKINAGKIKQSTASIWVQSYRQLLAWADMMEYMVLPKIFNSEKLCISITNPEEIIYFTDDEINKIYPLCDDELKLWVLLGLNCAMTQVDIKHLTDKKINWKNHTLTYKRKKTEKKDSVPLVEYSLWDATYKALEAYKGKNGGLLTENRIGDFMGILKDLGIVGKSFKHLRKTGSTKLFNSAYAQYDKRFLGHSEPSMAGKRYSAVQQAAYDKAIEWLGTQYRCISNDLTASE